jgi:hypothetical protein
MTDTFIDSGWQFALGTADVPATPQHARTQRQRNVGIISAFLRPQLRDIHERAGQFIATS